MDYHGIYTFIRLKGLCFSDRTHSRQRPPFPSPRRKQTGGHSHRPGSGAGTLTIKTLKNLMGVKMNPVFIIMCEREKHTMYSGGTLSLSFSGILTSVIAFKRPVLNDSLTAQASLPSGFICNSHPSLWSGNSDRASSGLLSRCKKCPPHKDLDTICKPCNCSPSKKHTFKIIQRL